MISIITVNGKLFSHTVVQEDLPWKKNLALYNRSILDRRKESNPSAINQTHYLMQCFPTFLTLRITYKTFVKQ